MTRTLFSCMVLRKFLEITNNKPNFSQCNINVSFFNLRFDLFSIIAKKSQSNQEQCSVCCSSPCFLCISCDYDE